MKKKSAILLILIILSVFISNVFAADIPAKTSDFYVNDNAGILSAETKQIIMNNSVNLQKSTGAQIVVVTINSLDGSALEEYSLNILRTWGIGDKEKNNGVLLLISVNDSLSRIEVGYGLEGRLPDGKTGRIQDEYMLPSFKVGNYDEGLKNGYLAILQEVANEYSLDLSSFDQPTQPTQQKNPLDNVNPIVKILLAIFVFLLLICDWIFLHGMVTRTLFLLLFRRGGGGGGFGGGGGGFSGGGGSGGGGGSSRSW